MDCVLKTYNLTKQYKGYKAVDNVSISVQRGDIYGFLGQNGAGKTTTIRMLMGLVRPCSGTVELFGERVVPGDCKHFTRIGALIEIPGFYPNLSAEDNLAIHCRLMGIVDRERVEKTLETVGMLDVGSKPSGRYSRGMKQRLGIARALLHQPELLILDEPTDGLDPVGIKEIRQLLHDLSQKRGITVFMSSHILSEVQLLATRIGIIHKGCLLEEIGYEELEKKNRHYVEVKVDDDSRAAFLLEQQLGIFDYRIYEPGCIRVYERLDESASINRIIVENGIDVKSIGVVNENLEDYFLNITGGAYNV